MSGELPLVHFDLRAPAVWLVPLLALAGFLVLLVTDQDLPLFLALNAIGPRTSDALWASITVLGDTVVALALCLVLWRRRPDLTWALVIGGLLSIAWVHTLKELVEVPRPPAVLGEEVHVIGKAYRLGSFPSGHSTTIFFVAGVFAMGAGLARAGRRTHGARADSSDLPGSRVPVIAVLADGRLCAAVALAVAVLVALSRSVVGVHWPLDLLAGAFGGWLAAALGLELARRTLGFGSRPRVQRILGLLLAGCAAALVIGYDSDYPQAAVFQRVLGVLCLAGAALAFVKQPVAR